MSDLVDTPMDSSLVKTGVPSGGPGEYDGEKTGAFGSYPRTSSPNGVPEKIRDGQGNVKPSGEADQF